LIAAHVLTIALLLAAYPYLLEAYLWLPALLLR
jgi:hypothetical protein